MSRCVQSLGAIEVVGDLDWPSFLTESARAYAKSHRATHWLQVGENQGFYIPEADNLGDEPFKGALYSAAALVYENFNRLAEASQRNVRELDLLVLLPCINLDEVVWVRLDDGVITQDLIMTGIDALERLRHLPSYVTVYSALDSDLPHANVKPYTWANMVQTLPKSACIRAARFQFKNLSRRAKLGVLAGVVTALALPLAGYGLYKVFKPKTVKVEAVVDHTEAYWDALVEAQKKSGDKLFALQIWSEMMQLPVVEDGWSRVRVTCRVDQCNHDWKLMAGDIQSLESKYKVATFTGDSARTEVPGNWKGQHPPIDLIESQLMDKQMSSVRQAAAKVDTKLALELTSPTQVAFPGLTHVKRFASQRGFVIKGNASSFPDILKAMPDQVVIDQIELTIEAEPKLVIEGKVYVL